eukprot:scaffold38830_cov46-Prasinocladus_malaysianus.AAC.2
MNEGLNMMISLLQRIVFGPAMGDWGRATFGTRLVLVESLRFHTLMLKELKARKEEHQLDAEVMVEPTGFVTFRWTPQTMFTRNIYV